MMRSLLSSLALFAPLLTGLAHAVHPVEVQGRDFVDSVTKKRFTIVGVDYQPGGQGAYDPKAGTDPLSDSDTCLRDAIVLQRLGVNTIRVYNVNPTLNHDKCASIFNAAGIYIIIDVNGPLSGESINRAEPWTSYHKDYLKRIFGVVEGFKAYPNTLAFFSANEVMNDLDTGMVNPQYIRAVQRDLKNYIKNHADRTIPVGYSAADVREILQDSWAYLQCAHDDDQTSSDFFGLNSYSWCGGDATFESAGYSELAKMFKDSSVPVFFSEYGCNEVMPRVFDEVAALYGDKMTALSGGLVYEYSEEESNYGLATINANGTVTLSSDYDNLQGQFAKLDKSRVQSTKPSASSIKAPECSDSLITSSVFDSNFTIPAVCPGCSDIIKNGIDKPVKGKLVEITETKAPKKIYGSQGGEIKGLALKILSSDNGNTPSGETTSTTAVPSKTPVASKDPAASETKVVAAASATATAGPATPTPVQGAASEITSGWGLVVSLIFAVLVAH